MIKTEKHVLVWCVFNLWRIIWARVHQLGFVSYQVGNRFDLEQERKPAGLQLLKDVERFSVHFFCVLFKPELG